MFNRVGVGAFWEKQLDDYIFLRAKAEGDRRVFLNLRFSDQICGFNYATYGLAIRSAEQLYSQLARNRR